MRRLLALLATVTVLAAGLAGLWLAQRGGADADLHHLFAHRVPDLGIALHRGVNAVEEMSHALEVADRWPEVADALKRIAAASPDPVQVGVHIDALNDALAKNALPYWIDGVEIGGRRALLTYEVVRVSTWESVSGRLVEVRHVRRLDSTNVAMGLVGHAGGGRPLVFLDRLEPLVVSSLLDAWDEETDEPWRAAWRASVERHLDGPTLARAATALRHREELFADITSGRKGLEPPDGFAWSPEQLAPYGAHLSGRHREALRAADRGVTTPELLAALESLLQLEATLTAAHEVHHVLTPEDAPPAEVVIALVGGDDLRFSRMADRELRAYLGQLHDGGGPGCLTVSQLAAQATLPGSRRTAHDYASRVLLEALEPEGGEEGHRERIRRLCQLSEEDLRARAAGAWKALYGSDFVPAQPRQDSLARAAP